MALPFVLVGEGGGAAEVVEGAGEEGLGFLVGGGGGAETALLCGF